MKHAKTVSILFYTLSAKKEKKVTKKEMQFRPPLDTEEIKVCLNKLIQRRINLRDVSGTSKEKQANFPTMFCTEGAIQALKFVIGKAENIPLQPTGEKYDFEI